MTIQDGRSVGLRRCCGACLQVLDQRRDVLAQCRAIVHDGRDISASMNTRESEVQSFRIYKTLRDSSRLCVHVPREELGVHVLETRESN